MTRNSQAGGSPKLATRGVFRLSRLSVSSYFKSFESKRRKNIPHKSSIADILKLFIFIQGACGTDKTRLKILDSDFTYYGVYSFCSFGVWFLFNYSKTSFKKLIAIQNFI